MIEGFLERLADQGRIPDPLLRFAIRLLCEQRLMQERTAGGAPFLASLAQAEIAPVPAKANEQHYEVPPEFFALVLGPHRKYSSCYWPEGCQSLEQAEAAALAVTAQRAQLEPGQRILELGCGWGSLSLWMAARFPNASITAVSNSSPQRVFIEAEARRRGLSNLAVLTADMNTLDPGGLYDRIVSVEMFEHMRNWPALFARIAGWLAPEGRVFLHFFCHRSFAYPFDTEGAFNWMGRYFFTGGMMPGRDLPHRFGDDLEVEDEWTWSGREYQRTAEAWLANLDARKDAVLPILAAAYGSGNEHTWFHRWRLFFLACAEVFGYQDGRQWMIAHYRLSQRCST
ncbi:MAG: cyclopropane-fatty-acyl-phospholipid synthase family protein [Bryobacteraceae bacterium]